MRRPVTVDSRLPNFSIGALQYVYGETLAA